MKSFLLRATVGDATRLDALASCAILDTPAEPGFDDTVLLVSQFCQVPVELVSLVAHMESGATGGWLRLTAATVDKSYL